MPRGDAHNGPGDRFANLVPFHHDCTCPRSHCSPTCVACLIHGMTRMHPSPSYNRTPWR